MSTTKMTKEQHTARALLRADMASKRLETGNNYEQIQELREEKHLLDFLRGRRVHEEATMDLSIPVWRLNSVQRNGRLAQFLYTTFAQSVKHMVNHTGRLKIGRTMISTSSPFLFGQKKLRIRSAPGKVNHVMGVMYLFPSFLGGYFDELGEKQRTNLDDALGASEGGLQMLAQMYFGAAR